MGRAEPGPSPLTQTGPDATVSPAPRPLETPVPPSPPPPSAPGTVPRGLATWQAVAFTAPLATLLLIESLVVKALQVRAATGTVLSGALVRAWAPDVALGLGLAVVVGVTLSLAGRRVRAAVALIYTLLLALLLVLTVATAGYFASTGSNLSWSGIQYWYANRAEVNRVIASEGATWKFVLTFGHGALVVALAVLPWLPRVRRRLAARGVVSSRRAVALVAGSALLAGVAALVPPADGSAAASCRSIPLDVLADAAADTLVPETAVEIREPERLDRSLEFTARPGAPRPNIVLILFESLRWKSSDVFVPDLGTTPFLAGLAKQGAIIDRQYTVLPHTTKAVMAANCGTYPFLDTTPREAMPGILPQRCLAHILKAQGYQSAFFQTAGSFEQRDRLVANMGYDTFRGLDDMPHEGFEETNYFGREERMMVRPSLEWVDQVRNQGPFLLTYLTLSTHHNYVSPQSWPYVNYPVDDPDERNYLNAVHYTDDVLREIIEGFRERGLIDNTVFLIVGDHGEAFGEHGGRQHDLILWEEGLHSFGMIYAPSYVQPGTHITGYRSHLDLVPTVTDLLGLTPTTGELMGTSLLKPAPENRRQYYSCWFKRRCLALRDGPVKVVYHYDLQPTEVFDTDHDPFDLHDLAGQGPYDHAWIEAREQELLRWAKVVNQQYDAWADRLTAGTLVDALPPAVKPFSARFGQDLELAGVDVSPGTVRAGQDLTVTTVYRATARPRGDVRLFMHVLHRDGMLNEDHVPAHEMRPVGEWPVGKYVVDEYRVHVPAAWSSGDARVAVGFWDKTSGKRLKVSGGKEVEQDRLVIAHVAVKGAPKAPPMSLDERRKKVAAWIGPSAPPVDEAVDAAFGGKVRLAGITRHRLDVNLAGTVEATYLFQALARVPASWKLTVKLVPEGGKPDASGLIDGDHVPIGGLYPPSDWAVGEFVQDRHKIHIDMHRCRPGTYGLWLGFIDGSKPVPVQTTLPVDARQRVKLGTVHISAKRDG